MNVKIKNWFDHKWLNYSGKKIVHFEEVLHPEKIATTNDWKERITIRPFHPNRVSEEQYFRKKSTGNHQFEKSIHKNQHRIENQLKQVAKKSDNGLYVWYSSNSKVNGHGRIMIYRVNKENVSTWYACIVKRENWQIRQTKGIRRNELQAMSQSFNEY